MVSLNFTKFAFTWRSLARLKIKVFVNSKAAKIYLHIYPLPDSRKARWCACMHVCTYAQYCATPGDPMDCSPQGSLSMEFSRQEYWSGLPFPPPLDLLNPDIEPASLASSALSEGFFITRATWEACLLHIHLLI